MRAGVLLIGAVATNQRCWQTPGSERYALPFTSFLD